MRKGILTLLLISIWLVIYAQPTKEYYENGQIKHIGGTEDGGKTGKWEFFYPDGTKEAIEFYKNDELEGMLHTTISKVI